MTMHRFLRQLLLAWFLVLMASICVFAQAPPGNKEFEPVVGQEGKDVVWVPTPQALADKMLNLAQVTPQDYVIDLGSGDGRIVITAAKRGARAHGIEYNPDMVELSKRHGRPGRRGRKGHVRQGGPLRERFFHGDGDHHVSLARHQSEASPGDSQPQTRHTHRLQFL